MPPTPPARKRPRPSPARATPARTPRAGTTQKERKNARSIDENIVDVVIEDIQGARPPVNIILNGENGTGKSVLAGGLSSLLEGRTVFLSTEEEGIVSAKRAGSTAGFIRAPDWEHAVSGLKLLQRELGPEDWAVFDSGTQMHFQYMRWVMSRVKALNPTRDLDIPALDNHQKIQNGFMRWYEEIIKSQFNVLFITTPMLTESSEGEERVVPGTFDAKGKVSRYISSLASVILYYDVKRDEEGSQGDVVRRLYAQPWPPFVAKDRYSALGAGLRVMENDFTAMADIVRRIYKAREEVIDAGSAKVPARKARRARPRSAS